MKRQHGFLGTFIFACAALLTLAAVAQPAGRPLRLVVLGDSLSAGYGLPQSAAFPAVLERSLKARVTRSRSPMRAFPATPRRAASSGSTGRFRTGPTG